MKKSSPQSFKTKRPLPLLLVAIGFLLSPFINLSSALMVGGHPRWFHPLVWFDLFFKLRFSEKSLMLSGIIVALLIFLQRKRSWFFAVLLLVLITYYNLFLAKASQIEGFQILSAFNIIVTLSMLIILYYFRYPYLDQRDSILGGMARRVLVKVPAEIEGLGECTLVNLSKTGCLVASIENSNNVNVGSRIFLLFKDGIKVECQVMHMKNGLGLKFENPSKMARQQINKWISEAEMPKN